MSYPLEKAINLLNNYFEEEIKKMNVFLDVKNHPEYLNNRIINRNDFINWTNSLHTIGLNEFSNEKKTSLFKTIFFNTLLDNKKSKINKNELRELIIDFLIEL